MSGLNEIYFNYNKAIQQANQLDSIAERLKNAAGSEMDTILHEVQSAWKSDSAPQYIQKGNKVKADMLNTGKNLGEIAAAIRTIAERVKRAELETLRIANERID